MGDICSLIGKISDYYEYSIKYLEIQIKISNNAKYVTSELLKLYNEFGKFLIDNGNYHLAGIYFEKAIMLKDIIPNTDLPFLLSFGKSYELTGDLYL